MCKGLKMQDKLGYCILLSAPIQMNYCKLILYIYVYNVKLNIERTAQNPNFTGEVACLGWSAR